MNNHNNHHSNVHNNHHTNGHTTPNNIPDDITQSDAVSPRFRNDLGGHLVMNFCYSCKSEFSARSIHDVMEHYSLFHDRYTSLCLYCKTGKVHQYKSDSRGLQYYHDCYRSKMNYDKWAQHGVQTIRWREIMRIVSITRITYSTNFHCACNWHRVRHLRNSDQVCVRQDWT